MGRVPKQTITAEINRIRRYFEENPTKSDPQAMQELAIKERTYYKYKVRIREQDRQAWLEIAKESLESAALKVKKSLDYCTKISRDVADNSQDQRARLEAAKKVVECSMMYYKMLKEGPTSTTIVLPKEVKEDGTDRRMESLGPNTIPVK